MNDQVRIDMSIGQAMTIIKEFFETDYQDELNKVAQLGADPHVELADHGRERPDGVESGLRPRTVADGDEAHRSQIEVDVGQHGVEVRGGVDAIEVELDAGHAA